MTAFASVFAALTWLTEAAFKQRSEKKWV